MRLPIEWLKQHVDPGLTAEQLADLLVRLGVEIEDTEDAPSGLGGQVLITEITPNRGDLLSIVGLAQEVAAATGAPLKWVESRVVEADAPSVVGQVTVRLDAPELCGRYAARLVRGVQPGPSPQWLQDRLLACGQRPIDILVDVTNYVMFELGQPLHAFDAAKLGHTIVVRRARDGEEMVTLDGVTRQLTADNLLITDGQRGVALAGVMGAENTEVTADTRDVLLEAAHFSGPNIRRTARSLNLESESSYRFARTVDPNLPLLALDRAAELLAEYAGGQVAPGVVDAQAREFAPATISLRPSRCNSFLGTRLSPDEMAAHLRALGLTVALDGDHLQVTVPTRRPDLEREVDLIEEVCRLHGYDNVPPAVPPPAERTGRLSERQRLERRVRELMLGGGLDEVQTFSLTSPAAMARANCAADLVAIGAVCIENAMSEEYSVLRWSLLPSLLEVVGRNVSVGAEAVRVFEVGRRYRALDPTVTDRCAITAGRVHTGQTAKTLPQPATEELVLAGAVTSRRYTADWNLPAGGPDSTFFEVKGLLDVVLAELAIGPVTVSPCDQPAFAADRAGQLGRGEQVLGVYGEVAAEVRERYDIRHPVVVFEVNLGALLDEADTRRVFQPLPRQPAALRDVALVVPAEVAEAELAASIRAGAGPALESLRLFDAYRGQGVPAGKRSLAYSLRFRDPARTLTDDEVDRMMAAVLATVEREHGAALRE